jgi:prepilin-type N-terminal cleavage/methylation domain-containing protein
MLKPLKNNKGVTLTELVVGMLVLAIIMLAVTSVFLPIYNAYVHANNMAEVNNLMNALSSVIMSDVESAGPGGITPGNPFTVKTRENITYSLTDGGFLLRQQGANPPREVFNRGFYRRNSIDAMTLGPPDANRMVTLTLGVGGVTRTYTARPIGLQ